MSPIEEAVLWGLKFWVNIGTLGVGIWVVSLCIAFIREKRTLRND